MCNTEFLQGSFINKALFVIKSENKQAEKRIRKTIPTYKKVYSLYQYDRAKYMTILFNVHSLAIKYNQKIYYRLNPYRVLNLCYLKDKNNELKPLGDEKHIFRIAALQRIYGLIYDYSGVNPMQYRDNVYKDGLLCWLDEKQAEIPDTWQLSIKYRILIHIKLLKMLRNGIELKRAVDICRY